MESILAEILSVQEWIESHHLLHMSLSGLSAVEVFGALSE
jgi:hypothetical protein